MDGECSSGVSGPSMTCCVFSVSPFIKEESDGMQLYLAATENLFVDRGTAAWLQGAYQVSAEPRGKHTFSQVGQIQLLWHKC